MWDYVKRSLGPTIGGTVLLICCMQSATHAQSVTAGGVQFLQLFGATVQANPGRPEFQTFFQMTVVTLTRLQQGFGPATVPQVINRINALGQLPLSVQAELVLEYFLIADIIQAYTLTPGLVQAWIDGVWGISVGPVSTILLPGQVFPSELAWTTTVMTAIRAAVNEPPAPPGTGLFETDPNLLACNLNMYAVLGNPNVQLQPCF